MKVFEILEGATNVWSRSGGKVTRKYRCTSGIRKGRTMSSPAACNAPKNVKKATQLTVNKNKGAGAIKTKTAITRRTNPASVRLRKLNKPKRRGKKI